MAIKRYTESQNIRFERHIVKLIDEALESQWCMDQGFNRSDLIRHLVRIGLHNFQRTQPMNREFMSEREDTFSSLDVNQSNKRDLFGDG
jgi:hypothetical protein